MEITEQVACASRQLAFYQKNGPGKRADPRNWSTVGFPKILRRPLRPAHGASIHPIILRTSIVDPPRPTGTQRCLAVLAVQTCGSPLADVYVDAVPSVVLCILDKRTPDDS